MKEIAGIKCYELQEVADILGVHYQTITPVSKFQRKIRGQ